MKLTEEQEEAIHLVNSGYNIFITSRGAGCGKTFLLNEIINRYKDNKIIAITASTGIASILLNGMTLHSWAGIGLGNKDLNSLYKKIKDKKNLSEKWKKTGISTWSIHNAIMLTKSLNINNFDFNGANSPRRGDNKHSFGSESLLYFNLKFNF